MNNEDNYNFLKSLKDKKKYKRTKSFYLKETFILTFVVILITAICSFGVCIAHFNGIILKLTQENNKNSKIDAVMNLLLNEYYESLTREELTEAAINGMTSILDKNSVYLDEDESSTFNALITGYYDGIGVEISGSEGVFVTGVFEGSTADKAGIKIGDKFMKIGEEDVSTADSSKLSTIIKGYNGKEVYIKLLRNEEELEVKLKVGTVTIKSISYKVIEKNKNKIGYIVIDIFSSNTYEQFSEAIENLKKQNIQGLIIDVRDNSGGYLTTASKILNKLLKKDSTIYYLQSKEKTTVAKVTSEEFLDLPIVILQNSASASASEVLSAALKENGVATIVGTVSYGKGTVQSYKKLSTGASIKYTIENWLTPNKNLIEGVGITPDVKVELSSEYYETYSDEDDNQLQIAIDELIKKCN